jgi:hypothetical protein
MPLPITKLEPFNVDATASYTFGNVTAGGYYFANGMPFTSSTYGNTEVAAYLVVNSTITALQSNAAFQASLIDTLTGNAATQGSALDVLVANAATQSVTLTTLLSNAAAQEASLSSLVGNTGVITANIGAYQSWANTTFTTYSNTNVAGYLAGNITTGNITTIGRVTVTTGLFWSNGTSFSSAGISKPTAMFNYMFGG